MSAVVQSLLAEHLIPQTGAQPSLFRPEKLAQYLTVPTFVENVNTGWVQAPPGENHIASLALP